MFNIGFPLIISSAIFMLLLHSVRLCESRRERKTHGDIVFSFLPHSVSFLEKFRSSKCLSSLLCQFFFQLVQCKAHSVKVKRETEDRDLLLKCREVCDMNEYVDRKI